MTRSLRMLQLSVFSVTFAALLPAYDLNEKPLQLANAMPLLRLDLRQFGYQGRPKSPGKGNEITEDVIRSGFGDYDPPRFDFIDKRTLAVQFERADPRTHQFYLKVLFLDSSTGELRWQEEWPTRPLRWFRWTYDTQSSVLPVHNGRFLVHANSTLKLYSPEFKLLQERELPLVVNNESKVLNPAPGGGAAYLTMPGDTWAVDVAPGGHIAVLKHIHGVETTSEWIDVDSLRTLHSLKDTNSFVSQSASEHALASFYDKAVRIWVIGKEMRSLCDQTTCAAGRPLFLTNEEVLVQKLAGSGQGFLVFSNAGEVLWSREDRIRCNGLLGALRSLQGNRFALHFDVCSRREQFDGVKLPKGEALLVYDRESRSMVFALHSSHKGIIDGGCVYALSPDASRLAVREGTEVSIYEIPSKSASADSIR